MSTPVDDSAFSLRWILISILGLVAILMVVIIVIISANTGAIRAQGYTVTPAFDDPRLSITLAYPFRGASGSNATSLPIEYMPTTIQRDFNHTQGIQDCTIYFSAITDIIGSCTVDNGLNTVEMAELLRLLADKQLVGITVDLRLSDDRTTTRYVWDHWQDGWQIAPLEHPSYDDPRLSLLIGYNPAPDLFASVTPATPDPRPYDERIRSAFEDTPGVQACTITLADNPYPPTRYVAGQVGLYIVNADCTVDPAQNTVQFVEWLRRLANRALLDTNAIFCEDMDGCNRTLEMPVATITLDDGDRRLRYEWNGRTWAIETENR